MSHGEAKFIKSIRLISSEGIRMKHTLKITAILVIMFFVTQMIGLFVAHTLLVTETTQVLNTQTGELENRTTYPNLPDAFEPPAELHPADAVKSIIVALIFAVCLMFLLMKLKAETFLRLWFFIVVIIGVAQTISAFVIHIPYSFWIGIILAIPLAIFKVFKRHIIIHNITELLIYPGIATFFIPILDVLTVVVLLVIISLYDMYAVWHAGFMQKMAKYQIEKVRVFSGFFVPYLAKKDRLALKEAKATGKKGANVKVNLAILGGGDVVFPILLAGVVLRTLGVWQAIMVSIGATIALAYLFYTSEKGKFYPAMPFISIGCLIGLAVAYLI